MTGGKSWRGSNELMAMGAGGIDDCGLNPVYGNDETETYRVDTICTNCRQRSSQKIPKGNRIDVYLKDKKCWKCGCFTLMGQA